MNRLEEAGPHVPRLDEAEYGIVSSWATRMRRTELTREHFHLIHPQQRLSHHLIVIRAASRGNRTDEFGELPKDCIDSISMSLSPFTNGVRNFVL